jgi:hypothetical protein
MANWHLTRSGQGYYGGNGENDILVTLVENFEKTFKQNKRAVTSAESTAVQAAIAAILLTSNLTL